MELQNYSAGDLWLTEALECDAEVMKELGGPQPREKIPGIHERRLGHVARGGWWFKIVPDAATGAVGTIGVWDSEWKGEKIVEMGWMMLPAFHGRGLASSAARQLLARARAEKAFAAVHAFPGTTNGASNAICRKSGFEKLEECDLEYDGRPLHCNHWRLVL
jgi:RimJ/RimL family protein N-acetyltransferase